MDSDPKKIHPEFASMATCAIEEILDEERGAEDFLPSPKDYSELQGGDDE